MPGSPKKASAHIPHAADQGMPYLAGAGAAGVTVQRKKVTQVGASPFAVNFEAIGLLPMADNDYNVHVGGETASLAKVQESSMTTAGFSVLNGANGEVLHLTIVGCLKNQAK